MPSKSKSQQRLMAEVDAAYIAGFFDGEGCIGIREHNKPGTAGGQDRRTPHYRLVIAITNRDLAGLKWIQERTGGTICTKSRGKETWAPAFELRLNNRSDCEQFLRQTLPYLKLKKRHAEVGLAFLELGLSRVTFSARGKTWPHRIQHPDDVAARKTLRDSLARMNGKGVAYAIA